MMRQTDLLNLPAMTLASLIRKRKVSSLEVVLTYIEKIQSVNPFLNALVMDRFDMARAEARKVDGLTANPKNSPFPPLCGVPCTIKESFAVTGMPNTAGVVRRKSLLSRKDATAVFRLRNAGAIPLGVTNTAEMCMWVESRNHVYGRTNNAYHPLRIAGGSSGGEGAIIGAGASPFGLASDVAGSIRIPAFFNGIFGHKPTGGMVPNTGHFPLPENEISRYATTGPMSRFATDLWPLLKIIAGPDGKDTACRHLPLQPIDALALESLSVIAFPVEQEKQISRELIDIQKKCVATLLGLGLTSKSYTLDQTKNGFALWASLMQAADSRPFAEVIGGERPMDPFAQLLKWLIRKTPHTLPAIGLALVEKFNLPFYYFLEKAHNLRNALLRMLDGNSVLIYPSYRTIAPFHFMPMLRPFDWVLTGIFNVMEFPATQVPLGLNKDNIPMGVQVISKPGNDHLTLAVAVALEKAFGGWVPPLPDHSPLLKGNLQTDNDESQHLLNRLMARYDALVATHGQLPDTDPFFIDLFERIKKFQTANAPEYQLKTLLTKTYPNWEILPVVDHYTQTWVRSLHLNHKAHMLHKELVFELANIFYLAKGAIFSSMRLFDTPYTICTCPTPENKGGCILTNWYYYGSSDESIMPNETRHGRRKDEKGTLLPCRYFPVRRQRECLGCGCRHDHEDPRNFNSVIQHADDTFNNWQKGGSAS